MQFPVSIADAFLSARIVEGHRSFICARHDCPAPQSPSRRPPLQGASPASIGWNERSARPLPLWFRLLVLTTMDVPSTRCPAALTVLALPMAAAILRAGLTNADGSAPAWPPPLVVPTLPAFSLPRRLPRLRPHSSHA